MEFGGGGTSCIPGNSIYSSRNFIYKKRKIRKRCRGRLETASVPSAAGSWTPKRLLLPSLMLAFEKIKIETRKITSAYMYAEFNQMLIEP